MPDPDVQAPGEGRNVTLAPGTATTAALSTTSLKTGKEGAANSPILATNRQAKDRTAGQRKASTRQAPQTGVADRPMRRPCSKGVTGRLRLRPWSPAAAEWT